MWSLSGEEGLKVFSSDFDFLFPEALYPELMLEAASSNHNTTLI